MRIANVAAEGKLYVFILAALCTTLFLGTTLAAPPAQARSATYDLDIPAQSLKDALQAFALASQHKLLYSSELVDGKRNPALRGQFTTEQAVKALLSGTNLIYEVTPDGLVLIRAEGQPPPTNTTPSGTSEDPPGANATAKEGKKSSSQDFRVAQVDQGKSAITPSVGNQTSNPSENSAIPSTGLSEIVVTAQKREERLQNVPISISVLLGGDLDKSTAQGVSEALNAVPGVATTENYLGGGTSVVIRGVQAASPLFTGSSAVAYYLDSVPFGLIRSAIAPDEDAYDLERVEVLRGPQGTLYGASALNGVVRVLSSDPNLDEWDLKTRVSDSYTQSGGNNYRGDLAVNIPIIEGTVAARAVVGYESDSGWINQPNKTDVNDDELRNYRLKLKAQPTEDLSIVLSDWSSYQNYGAPSAGYSYNRSLSLLDQPIITDFDAYGIKIDDRFAGYSLSSMTSYLDYKNDASLDLLAYGFPGSIFFSGLESNVFSQELNLASPRQGEWRWSVGGIYIRGTENNLQTYTLIGVDPETVDMVSKSYAVYGELTRLFFQDRLELTGGVRHYQDDVSQLGQLTPGTPFTPAGGTFGANTPRGVLTWHVSDTQMVYASYSQGFRSGFPQDPSVPAGYPSVRPDRLRNYELGSKGNLLGGTLAYDTSVYYMRWDEIQQLLLVPYAGVPTGSGAVLNGQAASGVGIDFALSAQPTENLRLSAAVSWNDLEMDSTVISSGLPLFQKGDRPNYSPETTADASAEYQFALGSQGYKGGVTGSVNYISQQNYHVIVNGGLPNAQAIVQPGDPMTVGRLSFSVLAPTHWTATLFADNVNNWRGTPIQPFPEVTNWNARVRPRTMGLKFDYHLR